MSGGVVLIREERKADVLDIRDLVAAALDNFCEQFAVAGRDGRRWVLQQMAEQARTMREEI